MRLASGSTILLATALAGPALWHALVVGDLELRTALLRYLIAVPVAAVMLAVLRGLTGGYGGEPGEGDGREPLHVTAVAGDPLPKRRTSDR